MMEFEDGTFGEVQAARPLIEALVRALDQPTGLEGIRAVHFGTPVQMEDVRSQRHLEGRIDDLEERVAELAPLKSRLLILPTDDWLTAAYKAAIGGELI